MSGPLLILSRPVRCCNDDLGTSLTLSVEDQKKVLWLLIFLLDFPVATQPFLDMVSKPLFLYEISLFLLESSKIFIGGLMTP